ncbi:MAG: DUF2764 domain-containing protein [Bacteroides sp.]|nr:DUF2764 domain-containing protein [Prevotella sp.]MCM1407947.1 DUF2764 domain-containing protein [Treponema brennaborense]MCM1469689.1 DUF2764 domain-containing protein [Bacteroides sp.]
MGSWYYLISQLPALSDSGAAVPITEEYFLELCSRFLGKKELAVLRTLSLEPPLSKESCGSKSVDAWYNWERSLRIALAQIRALRLKKTFSAENSDISVSPDIMQIAKNACGYENPLEAEQYLHAMRLAALNAVMPADLFSADTLFCYALKLKLIMRIRKFDTELGKDSYRKIYDQILGETA